MGKMKLFIRLLIDKFVFINNREKDVYEFVSSDRFRAYS